MVLIEGSFIMTIMTREGFRPLAGIMVLIVKRYVFPMRDM